MIGLLIYNSNKLILCNIDTILFVFTNTFTVFFVVVFSLFFRYSVLCECWTYLILKTLKNSGNCD